MVSVAPALRSRYRAALNRSLKLAHILLHPRFHAWPTPGRRCNVCQRVTLFACPNPRDRWIRNCIWCHSSPKYRAIAWVIERHLGEPLGQYLEDGSRRMYELTTTSGFHRVHRHRHNYVCSGYFPDRPFGQELAPRVWNADLQRLPFPEASFDLVVSSESLEHVRRPWQGFAEIHRVLKPGGFHCFTVPYRNDRLTRSRVDTAGPEDIPLLPKVYHQDPYCPEGCLVYTDYGRDLPELLERRGFHTSLVKVWDPRSDIRDDLSPVCVFLSEKLRA